MLLTGGTPAAAQSVSFQGATSFGVGDSPASVAVGDFNGDFDPDLAVANSRSGTVSVLLGGAGGSFGAATDFDAGTDPEPFSVAVGDFNADSDPDLAVANYTGSVAILLGGAGGSFGAATDFDVGDGPLSVAVGDFNADSDPDLAVANGRSGTVSVLLGAAGGSFGAATDFAAGDGPESVAVSDFNGDSDPDLAVANYNSDDVSVLLGGPGGGFGAATEFAAGSVPFSVAVGDFNGDSDPDLAVANFVEAASGGVSILLGGPGGGFGAPTGFAAGGGLRDVIAGDFNGDADPDLSVANFESNTISVLLNAAHPPAAPTLTDTDPDSPADDNSPRIKGTSEAGTTVRLYSGPDCSPPPAAVGSAADFAAPGLQVGVPDESVTRFTATATNEAGIISQCSEPLTYIEVSGPPRADLALAPNPVLTGDTVWFDASRSVGPAITTYEWDLNGDGSFETDTGGVPTASRSYASPGELSIGLRVTQLGQTDVVHRSLSVRLRPPSGEPGIRINGGQPFTNDPNVTVQVRWPAFAQTMSLSNDGGFSNLTDLALAAETPWALNTSGPERVPKVVYVRFVNGAEISTTFSDDITLDETPPQLLSAEVLPGGRRTPKAQSRPTGHRVVIRLEAKDRTSGVVGVQVKGKKKPGAVRPFKKKVKARIEGHKVFVRVQDGAGNYSRWKRATR